MTGLFHQHAFLLKIPRAASCHRWRLLKRLISKAANDNFLIVYTRDIKGPTVWCLQHNIPGQLKDINILVNSSKVFNTDQAIG